MFLQATNVISLEQQYSLLERQASASEFWDSQETAQATLQQMSGLKESLDTARGFKALLSDVQTAIELAELEVRPVACTCHGISNHNSVRGVLKYSTLGFIASAPPGKSGV